MQGTEVVLRLVLASLRSYIGKCVATFANAELAGEIAEQTSLGSCLGRARPVLSLEERHSEASSTRSPRLSSVWQHARRPTGSPSCLTAVVVAAGGGRGPTPLRCRLRKTGA